MRKISLQVHKKRIIMFCNHHKAHTNNACGMFLNINYLKVRIQV